MCHDSAWSSVGGDLGHSRSLHHLWWRHHTMTKLFQQDTAGMLQLEPTMCLPPSSEKLFLRLSCMSVWQTNTAFCLVWNKLHKLQSEQADRSGTHLVSRGVFALSLLCDMESEVLQQDDGPGGWVSAGSFHLCTHTVLQEGDFPVETQTTSEEDFWWLFVSQHTLSSLSVYLSCWQSWVDSLSTHFPSRVLSSATTGSREYFSGMGFPSGRPRWLMSTTDLAPLSRQCWMLGTAALILKVK